MCLLFFLLHHANLLGCAYAFPDLRGNSPVEEACEALRHMCRRLCEGDSDHLLKGLYRTNRPMRQ